MNGLLRYAYVWTVLVSDDSLASNGEMAPGRYGIYSTSESPCSRGSRTTYRISLLLSLGVLAMSFGYRVPSALGVLSRLLPAGSYGSCELPKAKLLRMLSDQSYSSATRSLHGIGSERSDEADAQSYFMCACLRSC